MTFRMMGPHERGRFAPEAWGLLVALRGAGVLNAAELEHLIDPAMGQVDGGHPGAARAPPPPATWDRRPSRARRPSSSWNRRPRPKRLANTSAADTGSRR